MAISFQRYWAGWPSTLHDRAFAAVGRVLHHRVYLGIWNRVSVWPVVSTYRG